MQHWVEQIGAVHVHSRYSDGSGLIKDILYTARNTGVDFVVMADHDTLAAQREGWEGRHDGVTLLVAAEVTPRRRGHFLAMRVRHCEGYAVAPLTEVLNAIQAQEGYVMVAHPMGARKRSLRIHHRPWDDWNHPAIRGMEIWSYMHDWVEGVVLWRLPEAYQFWRNPERRVKGPNRHVLKRWDALGHSRRISGIAGLDCHARRVPFAGIDIFPYKRMFGYLRNHFFIRPEELRTDPVCALWQALAEGRGFIAHDIIADAGGTRCTAILPDGRLMHMGEEARFLSGISMELALPRAAEVRWIVNGRARLVQTCASLQVRPCGPGVYRFEARLNGDPWVFTNPFYLR